MKPVAPYGEGNPTLTPLAAKPKPKHTGTSRTQFVRDSDVGVNRRSRMPQQRLAGARVQLVLNQPMLAIPNYSSAKKLVQSHALHMSVNQQLFRSKTQNK